MSLDVLLLTDEDDFESALPTLLSFAHTTRRARLMLKFGDLTLYPERLSGSVGGRDLGLTPTEFRLLSFLVQQAGREFTRTRLMHEVWGYDCNGRVRTVDVHVRRLRAKLGAQYDSMVDTFRGAGYMAVTPPRPRWVVAAPTLTAVRTSTTTPVAEPIAQ